MSVRGADIDPREFTAEFHERKRVGRKPKMSEADIAEARERYARCLEAMRYSEAVNRLHGQKALADEFGVSRTTLNRALNGIR